MPNWTSNFVYIEGDPADLRAFLEAVKWQDQRFDFNRIIPMPQVLKHTGSGHCTIDGKKVESYIVKRWNEVYPRQKEEVRQIGPQTARLFERILADKPHPEMGYRSCLGIIRLDRSMPLPKRQVDSKKLARCTSAHSPIRFVAASSA